MSPDPTPVARPSYRQGMQFSVLSFGTMLSLGIVSSIAIARLYGIRIIGENALSLAPIAVLAQLSTVREQAGLVRELVVLPHRAPRVTALFYVVLGFSLTLTIVVAIPILVGTWFVFDGPVGRPDLFLPALAQTAGFVLVTNTAWNYDMVLSAFRAGRELFHIRLWQTLSYLVLAIGLGAVWTSVWALVGATVGSWLTALIHRLALAPRFMTLAAPRDAMRDALRTLPSILRYGAKIAPGIAADGLGRESATWVLGAVAPLSAVGAYNRAAMLGQRMGEVNVRVGEMLFPTLVERRATADDEGFGRSLVDTMRYCGAGLLLVGAAGGGAAAGIMDIFGAGFSEGATALALLLAFSAIGSLTSCLTLALYAVERLGITTIMALVRLVVIIPLGIVLSLWLGVTGAALALVATHVAGLVWLVFITRASVGPAFRAYWPVRERLALVLAYVGGFVAARLIDTALEGSVGTLTALVGGSLTFALLFWCFGGINIRDRARIQLARNGRRQRRAPAQS